MRRGPCPQGILSTLCGEKMNTGQTVQEQYLLLQATGFKQQDTRQPSLKYVTFSQLSVFPHQLLDFWIFTNWISFIQAFYLILYDWLMVFVLLWLITCQQLPVTHRENSAWLKLVIWETFSSLSSFIYSLKNSTPVTVVHSFTRSYIQLLGSSDLFFHSHFFEPQL